MNIFPDYEELSFGAAKEFVRLASESIGQRGIFSVALCGGRTPERLYRLLATEFRNRLPWDQVHFFWGDERYVPPDSLESNYRLACESLLNLISIPPKNVHPMPTDAPKVDDAARTYEAILRDYFAGPFPEFDLALLGVGADGHTASLFPGSTALQEEKRWVVGAESPVTPTERLTLTLPALNASRQVMFLVTGVDKQEIIKSVLEDRQTGGRRFPAAMVSGRRGTSWFLDKSAASLLPTSRP